MHSLLGTTVFLIKTYLLINELLEKLISFSGLSDVIVENEELLAEEESIPRLHALSMQGTATVQPSICMPSTVAIAFTEDKIVMRYNTFNETNAFTVA